MFQQFTKSNLGLTLIGLGLLFFFFRIFNISLASFWPLILVAFGMYQIRSGGDRRQGRIFMGVGGVLLFFTLNLIGIIKTILPLGFVLAGLYFLTKNNNSDTSNTITSAFETAARGASRGLRLISRTIQNTFAGGSSSSSRNYASSDTANYAASTQDAHFEDVTNKDGVNANTATTKSLASENSGKRFSDPGVSSTVMFSSNKLNPDSLEGGGSSTCLFGDLKIDLRDVQDAPEKLKLDVTCGFGDIDIKVPHDWRVELRSSSFFADVSNEARTSDSPKTTLQVNANCFFGDIDISN